MYLNRLKVLRTNSNLTQAELSKKIGISLYTYINWERNLVVVPLLKMDELALYFNVSLSYILGITNIYKQEILKPLDYKKILVNLLELKSKNNHSYANIAIILNCSRTTIEKYFIGTRNIPTDKLIELAKFYKIDIDWLCGKK